MSKMANSQCPQTAVANFIIRANHSSVTFTGAFANAQMFDSSIMHETPIYAVFFSGLMKVYIQSDFNPSPYILSLPEYYITPRQTLY